MKTLITLVIGVGLLFLFTGFNEQSFLSKELMHDTLNGRYGKPMLQLSFIPDIAVQLVTGEYIQLPKLIDQKKYIFINIWSRKKELDIKEVLAIDSIAGVYKNKLLVIGLLDDGNLIQLKKRIEKHRLKNVKGMLSADIKKYLKGNDYHYGILFSKTGNMIEMGMSSGALATYMEKHVSVSRAKF